MSAMDTYNVEMTTKTSLFLWSNWEVFMLLLALWPWLLQEKFIS